MGSGRATTAVEVGLAAGVTLELATAGVLCPLIEPGFLISKTTRTANPAVHKNSSAQQPMAPHFRAVFMVYLLPKRYAAPRRVRLVGRAMPGG